MTTIIDIHTHRLDADGALISVDPRRFDPQLGRCYSVGFHPWQDLEHLPPADYELLASCALHPQVLAIGETGLDRRRGAPLALQQEAFVRHLELAHRLGKPVVAHCVKAAQDILAARHGAGLDGVRLIIHGIRGNEHVARALLDAGCYLSFGHQFNVAALQVTPLDRLLIETDDAIHVTIHDVAAALAQSLALPVHDIVGHVTANARRLLFAGR